MFIGAARCMASPSALISGLSATSQCATSRKTSRASVARSHHPRNSTRRRLDAQSRIRLATPRRSRRIGIASIAPQTAG